MIQQIFPPTNLAVTPATTLVDQAFRCDRCGFDRFIDYPIHNGASARRDCARCHRTAGFPLWYGAVNPLNDTRQVAREAIASTAGNLRQQILDFITSRPRGVTDEEIRFGLDLRESTARARRCELFVSGHVRDSKQRRRSTAGRLCIVWIATGKPLS